MTKVSAALAVLCACLAAHLATAQDSHSDFNLSLHAHDHATAADIGLPQYPGATPDKDKDSSDSADLGFAFGTTGFNLRVASYKTADNGPAVFTFYRKAMARYGDVLECDNGKAVGGIERTHSGLGCADQGDAGNGGNHLSINGSSDGHELRVGSPRKMRMMEVQRKGPETHFSLALVELSGDAAK